MWEQGADPGSLASEPALPTAQCDKDHGHGGEVSSWDTEEFVSLGDGIPDQEIRDGLSPLTICSWLSAHPGHRASVLASRRLDPALTGCCSVQV